MGAFDLLEQLRGGGLVLAADGDRLTVSPRDRLTDDLRNSIKAHKAELLAVLAAPAAPDARQAKDSDLIQFATEIKVRAEQRCGQMTALMETTQGRRTSSGDAKKSKAEQLADVGLSVQEAHRYEALAAMPAEQQDPQDLAQSRLIRMGLDEPDAAKLAEWMALRDENCDERITCYECKHFRPTGRRCSNHFQAGMPRELGLELATIRQRCIGFKHGAVF